MTAFVPETRPKAITIDRGDGLLKIEWGDGRQSAYPLRWLRKHCPCATCSEERRQAAEESDPLQLTFGPPPSLEIAGADLVGHYAVQLAWADGHSTGIYTFAALRAAAETAGFDSEKLPPLLAV